MRRIEAPSALRLRGAKRLSPTESVRIEFVLTGRGRIQIRSAGFYGRPRLFAPVRVIGTDDGRFPFLRPGSALRAPSNRRFAAILDP